LKETSKIELGKNIWRDAVIDYLSGKFKQSVKNDLKEKRQNDN